MATYSLTLRGEKGQKLTAQELDNNFLYLESLIGSGGATGGGSISEEVIEFEFLDVKLFESELADFTQPLTKSMTFSFSGFKDETETIRGPLFGFDQIKSVKKSYLGLVDSDFLFQTYFGGSFEPQELVDLLFNGKVILEFTQNDFYVAQEPGDELILFSKSFNYNIKTTVNPEGNADIEISIAYIYNVDLSEGRHGIKITEKGFNDGLFSDFPNILKLSIDNTGSNAEVPLRMDLSNLPDLANVNQDQLYIDENGFIKISRVQ
jgi:hypothetical protein